MNSAVHVAMITNSKRIKYIFYNCICSSFPSFLDYDYSLYNGYALKKLYFVMAVYENNQLIIIEFSDWS